MYRRRPFWTHSLAVVGHRDATRFAKYDAPPVTLRLCTEKSVSRIHSLSLSLFLLLYSIVLKMLVFMSFCILVTLDCCSLHRLVKHLSAFSLFVSLDASFGDADKIQLEPPLRVLCGCEELDSFGSDSGHGE